MSDEFLTLACLNYTDDSAERHRTALDLLRADPSIATRSVFTAAATADADAVAGFVATDSSAATTPGGPYGWPPLLYLVYARHDSQVAEAAVLATVAVLLAAGADPDSGFLWNGLVQPFTAVTGAFGEGERGPVAQPRHPHSIALARALLSAGADANDGQTLYNRMFGDDDDHLRLLFEFEFGLGRGDGGAWYSRLDADTHGGDRRNLDSPVDLVRGQLRWAVTHGQLARVQLLAEHGVDLVAPFDDGRTATDLAALNGDHALVVWLVEHGAPQPSLSPVDAFVAAALRADRSAVEALLAEDRGLLATVHAQRPSLVLRATVLGRQGAVELVAGLGFDVNALGRSDVAVEMEWETALHHSATTPDVEMTRLLLSLGADTAIHDRRFDGTPLGWAHHFDQVEQIALLTPLTRNDATAPPS